MINNARMDGRCVRTPGDTGDAAAPTCAVGDATPRSFNYTSTGRRVEAGAGVYWVPEREFASAVAAARRDPASLNRFRYVPLAGKASR